MNDQPRKYQRRVSHRPRGCLLRTGLTLLVLGILFAPGSGKESHEGNKPVSDAFRDIIGYWKSYPVGKGEENPGFIKVAIDSHGRLMQSVIYESAVQCRIWIKDYDISFGNGFLRFWGDEFRGRMDADKQSIRLRYKNRFGDDIPFVWERLPDPAVIQLLDRIEASQNGVYRYRIPVRTDDGLDCAHLEEVHIRKDKIVQCLSDILDGKYNDIHSLLIVKEGKLVLEEYFGARGRVHGPMINDIFRDRCQQLASVTKSVHSVLIGIAIDRGLIDSIDTEISGFFPNHRFLFNGGKERLNLRHLLTMSAGLEWNENMVSYSSNNNDAVLLQRSGDLIGYCLKKPLISKPGESFVYNSGLSIILGEILKRATGLPADRFAEIYLFAPLGINRYRWSRTPGGIIHSDGGLALRARDLAKLGLLFLNRGKWNGRQVISAEWVRESTTDQVWRRGGGYGYQWWTRPVRYQNRLIHSYHAVGYGGQFIVVIPDLSLIMVLTAQDFSRGWASRFFSLLDDRLLPAVD